MGGRPGKLRVGAFDSRGRMGLLDAGGGPRRGSPTSPADVAVRAQLPQPPRAAYLDLEQELCDGLGLFARTGKDQGNVEPYEFTDIDRTVSAGLSLQGTRWSRGGDTVGFAAILNGISADRERYLNAGGLGILVGDGKLPNPGPEKIIETTTRSRCFNMRT